MTNPMTWVLTTILVLCAAVAGGALVWAVDDHGSVRVDISTNALLVGGLLAVALLLVVFHLRAPQRFTELVTWILVTYLVGGAIVLGDLIVSLWDAANSVAVATTQNPDPSKVVSIHVFATTIDVKNMDIDTVRLLLILATGAVGGLVHVLWIFVARTGNASFRDRWAWWYLTAPIFGAAAAYGLTLAMGNGLVEFKAATTTDTSDLRLISFVAFVSGLFSKIVLERLSRLLPEATQAGPRITKVSPTTIAAAATGPQTLQIEGTGFTDGTVVVFEGTTIKPTKDGNTLKVEVDVTPAGTRSVALEVVNESRDADAAVIGRGT